jgi:hypothetical protein
MYIRLEEGQCPSNWHQRDIDIVGVYKSNPAAKAVRRDLIEKHKCRDNGCGGNDKVWDSWDDEIIDLVIQENMQILHGDDIFFFMASQMHIHHRD